MAWEITMKPHKRQPIDAFVMPRRPCAFGGLSGDSGIHDRQLIHQLAGTLNERFLASAVGHDRLIASRTQRAIVFQPPQRVWRCFGVERDAGPAPKFATNSSR